MIFEKKTLASGSEVRLVADTEIESPADFLLGTIAYVKNRRALGTSPVDFEEMDAIGSFIQKGKLIGRPVFAYVHGGTTLSMEPFGDRFDSGRSGFIYCTADKLKEFGLEKADAEKAFQSDLDTMNQYLNNDVYGVEVHRKSVANNELELVECFYGIYGIKNATEALNEHVLNEKAYELSEATEKSFWEERDVVTV